MNKDKQFWDRMARRYNKMLESYKPYQHLYEFIKKPLRHDMQVLEVGTGSGLIARSVADKVKQVIATDYSEEMIAQAKSIGYPSNVKYFCANIFNLPYDDGHFDVVIASNILHIIPTPEKALAEISRVLKPNGKLIAPTYLWEQLTLLGRIQKFVMLRKNFPIQSSWNEASYKHFIQDNGFAIVRSEVVKASFTIACVECKKHLNLKN